jgi:hypothetical protein
VGFLPLADPRRIFGIAEITLVLGLGQPSLLAGTFAGLLAARFGAKALTPFASIVGKKQFVAAQALALILKALHRFRELKEWRIGKTRTGREENPTEEKSEQGRRKKKFKRTGGRRPGGRRSNS